MSIRTYAHAYTRYTKKVTMQVIKRQKNSRNCIICGLDNPLGVKAAFYNMQDGSAAALFTFKSEHQSYPNRTHGGMVCAMLDELIGRALWVKEPDMYGVTTTLNITYRKITPYDVPLKGRAYITHNSAIGFSAKGEIYDMNDNLLAEASARYFKLKSEKAFGGDVHADEEMIYDIKDDVTEINFPPIK